MKEETINPACLSEGDDALVRAFKAGDKGAFDKLVIRHKDRVFNLVYWFLGDYQEANDCAQETFIKVFRSLKRFRFESAFSTWLYRIAMNTCKNRVKSSAYKWKMRTVPLGNPEGSRGGNPHIEIEDDSQSPMNELERRDRLALIREAINSLPGEQNRVVVLRDIQGLSYEEIAETTGLKLGTVKSRLARGRLGLRNRLEGRV